LGKGKKLFSILSLPAKPKSSFSGISSDDFATIAPPPLPPRKKSSLSQINTTEKEQDKPLPAIHSPADIISPKDIISSLLPPIVHKIESGNKEAIEKLVISTIEVDSQQQKAFSTNYKTVIDPVVVEASLLTVELEPEQTLVEKELGSVLYSKEIDTKDSSDDLSLTIHPLEIKTIVSELSSPIDQRPQIDTTLTTEGVSVAEEILDIFKIDEDDAQFRLQDLLTQAATPFEEVLVPKPPTTPKSPRRFAPFSAPFILTHSIQVQTNFNETVEIQCQTDLHTNESETQTFSVTTDSACSPLMAGPITIDAEQQTDQENNESIFPENEALKQELEKMRLMVIEAKSQTQQMKILKEAAESRFEQLARVAHKKLVRAMVHKHQ
jgi:hypothetical protein